MNQILKVSLPEELVERVVLAMSEVVGDTEITLDITPDFPAKERKPHPERTQYKADLSNNLGDILEDLGRTTIKGVVFQAIVGATIKGDAITKRGISKGRNIKSTTLNTVVQELRESGFIVSEDIQS